MLKRFLLAALVLMLSLAVIGCNKDDKDKKEPQTPPAQETPKQEEPKKEEPADEAKYDNGVYYAEGTNYSGSGWMYNVILNVADGKISDVAWNATSINGGPDKVALGEDYGMKKAGSELEWDEQAEKVEALLLDSQDVDTIKYDGESGALVDEIAGVSISVDAFVELVKEALANGPVAQGEYKDGFYYAVADDFYNGFKTTVHVAVVNGKIVGANFNGIGEETDDNPEAFNKYKASAEGIYDMKVAGAQADWHEQAEKAAAYLVEKQDASGVEYTTDEGETDDIAGVTMKVKEFFELAEKALAGAK